MIAFIGLGNPGAKYAATKHNAGFWVLDELAQRWKVSFKPGKGDYLFAEAKQGNVLLAKPTTGMNACGPAVKEILQRWNIDTSNLYVVVDDVDLPLGTLRIRPHGGDGCHRGMASVIYHLVNDQFPRIRLGIATDEQTRPAEDFVLKPFRNKDAASAREMVLGAADAVQSILFQGLDKTMSTVNRIKNSRETE